MVVLLVVVVVVVVRVAGAAVVVAGLAGVLAELNEPLFGLVGAAGAGVAGLGAACAGAGATAGRGAAGAGATAGRGAGAGAELIERPELDENPPRPPLELLPPLASACETNKPRLNAITRNAFIEILYSKSKSNSTPSITSIPACDRMSFSSASSSQ